MPGARCFEESDFSFRALHAWSGGSGSGVVNGQRAEPHTERPTSHRWGVLIGNRDRSSLHLKARGSRYSRRSNPSREPEDGRERKRDEGRPDRVGRQIAHLPIDDGLVG